MSSHSETHQRHILPLGLYLNVFVALLTFTAITVWVSYMDFGVFNLLVAMTVAVVKASLVAMYFMHLRYDNKLYTISFLLSIFLLGVFIILTLFDTLRRDDIYDIKGGTIKPNAAMYDNRPPVDTTGEASAGN
ncbi:MAG: cytochrome C oxidase subunit IV family protein [Candidatus Zixiibacteriota bacterium]